MAVVTAAVRSSTPSLANACKRCVFTVASPMNNAWPTSALVLPSPTSASTSSSLAVSSTLAGAFERPNSLAATTGAKTVAPAAAARSALDKVCPRRVLEQVTGGTGFYGPEYVMVGVVRGQHEYGRRRFERSNAAGGLHAVCARHSQVHEHDVRTERGSRPDCFLAIAGFSHDLQVRLPYQHPPQPLPHHRVVVHEEQP